MKEVGGMREREGREGQEALRFKWFGWTESGSKQYRKSHRIRECYYSLYIDCHRVKE